MSEEERVIEIHPNGRYAILVPPERATQAEMARISERLKQWQESNEQFLILHGSVKLVRVDE